MEIVKLEIKDLNLIQTLAHKTWQETYTTILSKDQLEFMLEEIYSLKSLKAQIIEGQEFYGFSFENQIVGFASISKVENKTKLNKIYILKASQGNGNGSFFISEMEKIAKQSGSEFITLNVNRFNSASIFYIKKGYVIDSEIDIPFGDFWLNDYTMIKKL